MDVKCAVYRGSDDKNGDNVDVRIFVLGLKNNTDYSAQVMPDHNPPVTVTTKTDSEGIFWVAVKVPNGDKSTLFNVNIYQGNNTDGRIVATGDDDAPCYDIRPF
jgi:hypothetical protein